jgi:hypothetical protein
MILFLFFSPLPTEPAAAVKASHNFLLSTNSIKRRRPRHEHNSNNEDYPKAATRPVKQVPTKIQRSGRTSSTCGETFFHRNSFFSSSNQNFFFSFFFFFKNLQASSPMLLLHRTWQKIPTPTSPI